MIADRGRHRAPRSIDRTRGEFDAAFAVVETDSALDRGTYVRGGGGICRVWQDFLSHDPLGGDSEAKTHEDVGFAVTAAAGWEYKLRPRLRVPIDVEYTRFVANHVGGDLFAYTAGFNY